MFLMFRVRFFVSVFSQFSTTPHPPFRPSAGSICVSSVREIAFLLLFLLQVKRIFISYVDLGGFPGYLLKYLHDTYCESFFTLLMTEGGGGK